MSKFKVLGLNWYQNYFHDQIDVNFKMLGLKILFTLKKISWLVIGLDVRYILVIFLCDHKFETEEITIGFVWFYLKMNRIPESIRTNFIGSVWIFKFIRPVRSNEHSYSKLFIRQYIAIFYILLNNGWDTIMMQIKKSPSIASNAILYFAGWSECRTQLNYKIQFIW